MILAGWNGLVKWVAVDIGRNATGVSEPWATRRSLDDRRPHSAAGTAAEGGVRADDRRARMQIARFRQDP